MPLLELSFPATVNGTVLLTPSRGRQFVGTDFNLLLLFLLYKFTPYADYLRFSCTLFSDYLRITCGFDVDYLLIAFFLTTHAIADLNAAGKYIFTRSAWMSALEDVSMTKILMAQCYWIFS